MAVASRPFAGPASRPISLDPRRISAIVLIALIFAVLGEAVFRSDLLRQAARVLLISYLALEWPGIQRTGRVMIAVAAALTVAGGVLAADPVAAVFRALDQAAFSPTAGIAAACALAMILAALWPGLPERVTLLPDTVPGQTAVRRRDLASLVRTRVEQIGGVHSATVTTRRSRVDVVVLSVLDDLEPVQEAARKTTDEALETLQPAGITRSRVRIKRTS